MIFKKNKKMSKDKVEQEELKEDINSNDENAETADSKEEIQEEVKEKTPEEKFAELNGKYIRLYSDFDNFRKRTIKEKADIISTASSNVIGDLLTVLDDFDRAILNNEKSDDVEGLKEGFKLIHSKFSSILKGKGLEEVNPTGDVFDAEVHEAITNIPAPTENDKGKIIDCIEKGYNLRGKAIRYPKVVVGQ